MRHLRVEPPQRGDERLAGRAAAEDDDAGHLGNGEGQEVDRVGDDVDQRSTAKKLPIATTTVRRDRQ